jgi:hypothetical protein
MPITLFLDDSKFDPGAKRVVSVAFEMARVALQLGNQGNPFRDDHHIGRRYNMAYWSHRMALGYRICG